MSEFRAKDIGMRAQKKLASKLSNKTVAKMLVDDNTSQLLDNLCLLCKQVSGDKAAAEKVTKNIIKVMVKVGLLNRNDQFNAEERQLANKFQRQFQTTALTIISFYEVDFTYDHDFILKSLADMQATILALIERHLTDKTKARVEHVFGFFAREQFLDAVFASGSSHRALLGSLTDDLHTLLETFEDSAG
ncbi:tumor necrosis factor alpha-induced protein 8-like protein [Amphibalanus amphitrite]|uniref:tumor necrosis factor alpha-induced protein 8-like protein n=1 Tax=Amphibalanus amphitrite TaxID=1232801 RepID=UPI001C91C4C3|nr:tumor necrosis factor alpha-induced protein 8-like protein [Amphibalanus amphitrite]